MAPRCSRIPEDRAYPEDATNADVRHQTGSPAGTGTYAWSWWDAVHRVTSGQAKDLGGLFVYYSWNESSYPRDAMRMTFVTNHDKNAWEEPQTVSFKEALYHGKYTAFFGGHTVELDASTRLELKPWGYQVFVQ
jgi:hypothetical protein